jgi:branched-subunit amino acid transport protein
MNTLVLSLLIAIVVYSCRLSGFVISSPETTGYWQAYLQFLPTAIFSAFIVPTMLGTPDMFTIKLMALGIAGGIMWRTRRFGLSILIGLGVLWLLTLRL